MRLVIEQSCEDRLNAGSEKKNVSPLSWLEVQCSSHMYMFMFESFSSKVLTTLLALVLSYHGCRVFSRSKRAHRRLLAVPHTKERVLIIGASSGVGAEIARLYAFERGARVGIVGRNEGQLRQVFQELASSVEGEILWDSDLDTLMHAGENEGTRIKKTGSVRRKGDPWAQHFAIVADCSDAGDVARLQETVHACKLIITS